MITIVALKCNLESILSEPRYAVPFVPSVNETLRHYIMRSLCVGSGASAESKVCSRAQRPGQRQPSQSEASIQVT